VDISQRIYEEVAGNREVETWCQTLMFHMEFNDKTLRDFGGESPWSSRHPILPKPPYLFSFFKKPKNPLISQVIGLPQPGVHTLNNVQDSFIDPCDQSMVIFFQSDVNGRVLRVGYPLEDSVQQSIIHVA
jgi:hypothetical protein